MPGQLIRRAPNRLRLLGKAVDCVDAPCFGKEEVLIEVKLKRFPAHLRPIADIGIAIGVGYVEVPLFERKVGEVVWHKRGICSMSED